MASGGGFLSYYETEFSMHYWMKYSRTEILDMLPLERDILVLLFNKQMEKEKDIADKNPGYGMDMLNRM